jgi:hypothetical protein
VLGGYVSIAVDPNALLANCILSNMRGLAFGEVLIALKTWFFRARAAIIINIAKRTAGMT